MSTNDLLTGLALVVVLGLGCELVAARTRLPVIVLLIPVGFAAGAATGDVRPASLFGATFQPIVSLGVGLILFEAGLRLRLDELRADTRRLVRRLIPIGIAVSAVGVTVGAEVIFGLPWGPAAVLGAILVVSGPTVVLPLLEFVRPTGDVRSVLKWEGVLIDPLGALLGILAFHAVEASAGPGYDAGGLALSLLTGLGFGLVGAVALRALLRGMQRDAPAQSVSAALVCVVGAVAGADLVRDDSGFVAATVMGMLLANRPSLDVSEVFRFQARVVKLIAAMLFILISASVRPDTVVDLLPGGVALIALMVVLLRPVAVALGTAGSRLSRRERAFMAWLAPRGIVAAATASAFGPQLSRAGVAGAGKILPIAFIAIFGTVVVYGLTAAPLGRRLHVVDSGSGVVLIVGGHAWARSIAAALTAAGARVRLWTGQAAEQDEARGAGLEARNARLTAEVAEREAELEDVTDALVLTDNDDLNALAAHELRQHLGSDHVYSLPSEHEPLDAAPEYARSRALFGEDLTFRELAARFEAGATLAHAPAARAVHALGGSGTTLLIVSRDGRLRVGTAGSAPELEPGDTAIWLDERRVPSVPAGRRGERRART